MNKIIRFPNRKLTRNATPVERIIANCIERNQSITIGTSLPNLKLAELQRAFPEAKFEINKLGVKLICSST